MCTAITLKTEDFYFGRTLDNEYSYLEEVTVMPRNFPLNLKNGDTLQNHYAVIGMAFNKENYPLYYDAVNEKGLCIAGLNFVGNTYYREPQENKINIAQFELIPYILGKCATTDEAVDLIKKINITKIPFSAELPLAQLHWIIADKDRAITLESTENGINIYENTVGVLSNNPEFPQHLSRLDDYIHLSTKTPENTFLPNVNLKCHSKGMGALGLPGDLSSTSRFVRAAFSRNNSVCETDENSSVHQFFHIIGDVSQTRGINETEEGFEITIYTSCCNAQKGIYYYTTYNNSRINGINMHNCDLNADKLFSFPLKKEGEIWVI